jgi:arylsulfatase
MKMTLLVFSIIISIISCKQENKPEKIHKEEKRPNILLIMGDDMGYTDIGCFGSEVETPNIDGLAEQGLLFTNFHTSVSCSPTRSMLMSGTDNHIAGLGNMAELLTDNQKGKPGYEGHLNNGVVSLAEIFQDEGYHTYMAGKWHLGDEPEHTPYARGFERSFSMLQGGASHWSDMTGIQAANQPIARYVMDDKELKELPKDFYSSRSYADFLIDAIRSQIDDDQPFLAYYAPTAAHDPIHVPEPWLSKYRGNYNEGYEVLKSKRIKKAKELGIVNADATQPGFLDPVKPWNELSEDERTFKARTMEAYAGQIDNLDYHIGRLINYLKDVGKFENTIIIFCTDNGPNPLESEEYLSNKGSEWFDQFDNSLDNIGRPNSFVGIGIGWAQACAGPLDYFKMTTGEGGIRTPLIICGPKILKGNKTDAFTYIIDILPTLLEFTGIEHPNSYNNREVEPLMGHSLAPLTSGSKNTILTKNEIICGEMLNGKWAIVGDYKATQVAKPFGDGKWYLYNIKLDPGEIKNLSEDEPLILKELLNSWNNYSLQVGIIE